MVFEDPRHIYLVMICALLKRWMIDTSTVYRCGMSRLGSLQTLIAATCIMTGAILMVLNNGAIWAGLGIWAGIPFLTASIFCLASRRKKPQKRISPPTIFCTIAVAFAVFLFITSAINIHGTLTNVSAIYPSYQNRDKTSLLAINSVLLLLSILEGIVGGWAACILASLVCHCCLQGRERVYTIPYEPVSAEVLADSRLTVVMESLPNTTGIASHPTSERLDIIGLEKQPDLIADVTSR